MPSHYENYLADDRIHRPAGNPESIMDNPISLTYPRGDSSHQRSGNFHRRYHISSHNPYDPPPRYSAPDRAVADILADLARAPGERIRGGFSSYNHGDEERLPYPSSQDGGDRDWAGECYHTPIGDHSVRPQDCRTVATACNYGRGLRPNRAPFGEYDDMPYELRCAFEEPHLHWDRITAEIQNLVQAGDWRRLRELHHAAVYWDERHPVPQESRRISEWRRLMSGRDTAIPDENTSRRRPRVHEPPRYTSSLPNWQTIWGDEADEGDVDDEVYEEDEEEVRENQPSRFGRAHVERLVSLSRG
ncbi:Hypothetical predicted protein [Lecanosticta acicola]|uniref:Uncharacterized protein n=1 Tax=Lecanosticta acicola TaxID=111012 RepID=A0AAI9EA59_9PEZI|nr:Hypothetical predicted protein [Lecanosticta acicola]